MLANCKHPEYAHCTPYVNLNGNSRRQLVSNCYKILESISEAMDNIARSDLNHGRNAMDKNHGKSLEDSVTKDIETLRQLSTKYNAILDNLSMDAAGNYFKI